MTEQPKTAADGMHHLTNPEYAVAMRRAYKDGQASALAEARQQDGSALRPLIRGLEAIRDTSTDSASRQLAESLLALLAALPPSAPPALAPAGLLTVPPEIRERMQRYETGRNDETDSFYIAATDRTVLIGKIDHAARVWDEMRRIAPPSAPPTLGVERLADRLEDAWAMGYRQAITDGDKGQRNEINAAAALRANFRSSAAEYARLQEQGA